MKVGCYLQVKKINKKIAIKLCLGYLLYYPIFIAFTLSAIYKISDFISNFCILEKFNLNLKTFKI